MAVHDGDARDDVRLTRQRQPITSPVPYGSSHPSSRHPYSDPSPGLAHYSDISTYLCPFDPEEVGQPLEVSGGGQSDGVDVVVQPRHAQDVQLVVEEAWWRHPAAVTPLYPAMD